MKKFYFKKILLLTFLLLFFIFINANTYVSATFNDISQNTFRLHVIANTDSTHDQFLKFKIRDNIIEYFNSLNIINYNKKEIINTLQNNLPEISKICTDTLKEYDSNYNVELFIGDSFFPTKNYGDIYFPAGNYSCLKIKIGEASGQNWWCSLFPPLCFADISNGYVQDSDKESLKDNLSNEEYLLLSSNDTNIKLKFKIIEIINSLKSSSKLSS